MTTTTKRTNPFKSSQNQRTNFPPLEGFFKGDKDGDDDEAVATEPGTINLGDSNHSFHSRSKTCPSDLLNFSVDMSIAGKAELAQHRYHVSKYGIDNSFLMPSSNDSSPDGTPFKRRERDEWDRLMDDSNPVDCSMISLSSTAVLDRSAVQLGAVAKQLSSINNKRNAKVVVGIARTPSPEKSPDQSSDDDDDTLNDTSNRSSFFDRSMIQSLITPVKSRYKLASVQDQMLVNKQRGQECYESSSTEDEESPAKSETHNGSTFEHMILRFNEDFDNDVDKTEDEEGESPSKNTSVVSFAADTSFRTGDTSLSLSKKKKRKKKRRNSLKSNSSSKEKESFIKEALKGLDLLSTQADPEQQQKIDEISNALKGLGILSSTSPIPKQQNLSYRSTSSPSSHGVSSLESPGLTPSPTSDETSILKKKPSPTDLNNLLLSPIDVDKSRLSEVPFDEEKGRRRGSSSVPFDESVYRQTIMKPLKHVDSQSSLMSTEFTDKRNLFQDEKNQESNASMNKKKFDHCCTLSTVKSEESYLDDKADDFGDFVSIDKIEPNKLSGDIECTLSGVGEGESPTPFKHKRRILVDVTSRLNCNNGDTPSGGLDNTLDEDFKEEERRGVRLCRLEKMKQLGLTHLLTKPSRRVTEQIDVDSSF